MWAILQRLKKVAWNEKKIAFFNQNFFSMIIFIIYHAYTLWFTPAPDKFWVYIPTGVNFKIYTTARSAGKKFSYVSLAEGGVNSIDWHFGSILSQYEFAIYKNRYQFSQPTTFSTTLFLATKNLKSAKHQWLYKKEKKNWKFKFETLKKNPRRENMKKYVVV